MNKKKILIVDDNEEIIKLITLKLEEKYSVIGIMDNEKIFDYLYQEKPDLILLDIMMPGMSGIEVLKQIRKKLSIPIIMITALNKKKHILDSWGKGANFYFEKPIDFNSLREKIDELLAFRKKENRNFSEQVKFYYFNKKIRPEIITLIEFIENNYQKKITLSELSSIVNLHPYYLSKLFKKETGFLITKFITKYRLCIADKLLKKGTRINQIAYQLGYSDEKYFNRVYKKLNGITPSEYRHKYTLSKEQ